MDYGDDEIRHLTVPVDGDIKTELDESQDIVLKDRWIIGISQARSRARVVH
jgi:lipoate-protein ligase A